MKNTTYFKSFLMERGIRRWVSPIGCLLFLLMTSLGMTAQTTVTLGSGTTTSTANTTGAGLGPVNAYYEYMRYQVVYTAAEITAAGGSVGMISQFGFNVAVAPATLPNYKIRMATTSATNSASHNGAALTEVYSANYTPSAGFNMFTLSTPFFWDGTSNVLIDVCYGAAAFATPYGTVYTYGTDADSSRFSRADGTPQCGSTTNYTNAWKPQARFVIDPPPTCLPVSGVMVSGVTNVAATVNWTASTSAPASGYDYYLSTTNTAPTAATAPTNNVPTGTTLNLSALPANTTQYIWVRANCGGGDTSFWAAGPSFTTLCDPATLTYTNGFNAATSPDCWTRQNLGIQTGTKISFVASAFNKTAAPHEGTHFVMYNSYSSTNGGAGAEERFISAPLTSTGISSVDVEFYWFQNNGPDYAFPAEGVTVEWSADGGATWNTETYFPRHVATAPVAGEWSKKKITLPAGAGNQASLHVALKFHSEYGYNMYVDTFTVKETPQCAVPDLEATTDITKNSATISWTAPETGIPTAYEYVVTATAGTPAGAGTETEDLTVDLTSLDPSTMYYVYVRTVCTDIFSDWTLAGTFMTLCDYGDVLTTEGDSVCGQGIAELSATVSEDGILTWYAAETGGAALATGETFTTPLLTETTEYYVSGGNLIPDSNVQVGMGTFADPFAGYSPYYNGYGGTKTQYIYRASELQAAGISAGPINSLGFNVSSLNDPNVPLSSFAISVGETSQDTATTTHIDGLTPVYANASQVLTTGWNTYTFDTPFEWDGTSNIVVQVCFSNNNAGNGSAYTFYYTASYVGSTYSYSDNQTPAAICGIVTGSPGNGGTYTSSARANTMFNATAICESARVMVTAEVTDAPDIEVTESGAVCAGESFDLSVESANADYEYVWMPGNLSGAEHTVTPTETTTYIVTATDETTGCVETAEVTVTVNLLPTPVTITPADGDVCLNSVVALTGNGGESAAAVEYCSPTVVEDGATSDYLNNFSFANITNNNSGDAASDYTYYSALTADVVAGEPYTVTLQGGSATWSQQFRIWIDFNQDGVFSADESVFNTTTGSTAQVTGSITVPTTAFNGVTRMRVADRFSSSVPAGAGCSHDGFGEYEDYNVSITGGTNAVEYVWSPEEGLFMDEAATMPYTGEPAMTVYYYATEDAEFTATATSEEGCTASGSTELTVVIIPAPAAAAAQTFCAGATVADLAITDADAVAHWYYSAVGGNELAETTPLLDGTPYFAAQTVDGCESVARTMVMATVNTVDAPEASDDVQTFCNAATLADVEVDGENVMWYAAATGGDALAGDMALEEGISLYFASQTVDGCESPMRTAVAVELNVTAAPMVADDAPIFCNSATIADIMVEGDNVMWYDAAEGGEMLSDDTVLIDGGVYYASQTVNGCESADRTMVNVSINAPEAPTGDDTQEFCFVGTVGDLVADGAAMWYDAAEGGNMLSGDVALTNGGMYYASQVVDGCESMTRFAVTVTLTVVEADAPENVFACYEYTLPELNNGNYYTDSNGAGQMLAAGTVITETTTLYVYYVGASELGCSDENTFTVVIGNAMAPTGDDTQQFDVTVGEEVTIADIEVATEGVGTITWYASAEDAAAGENALSMDTVLADGMTYYATFTIGDCTSEEAFAVMVDVVLGRDGFDASAFTYYPNPVQDVLNMSYTSEISSVEVFNLLGQKVISIQPNATEVKLNMASLSDATYIVNVTSGDSIQTIKVVKRQ